MSNSSSIRSALKRLTEWSRWQQHDHGKHPVGYSELDNPYAKTPGRYNHIEDIAMVCAALDYIVRHAEHYDSHDGQPIFTVDCDGATWRAEELLVAVAQGLKSQE